MDLVYIGDPGDFICWQVSDWTLPGIFLLDEHLLDDPPERLTPQVLTTFFPTFMSSKLSLVHVLKHWGIFNILERVTHLPLVFKYSSLPLLSPSSHSLQQPFNHGWTPWDIFFFVCLFYWIHLFLHSPAPSCLLSFSSSLNLTYHILINYFWRIWLASSLFQIWKLRVNFLNLVTCSILFAGDFVGVMSFCHLSLLGKINFSPCWIPIWSFVDSNIILLSFAPSLSGHCLRMSLSKLLFSI